MDDIYTRPWEESRKGDVDHLLNCIVRPLTGIRLLLNIFFFFKTRFQFSSFACAFIRLRCSHLPTENGQAGLCRYCYVIVFVNLCFRLFLYLLRGEEKYSFLSPLPPVFLSSPPVFAVYVSPQLEFSTLSVCFQLFKCSWRVDGGPNRIEKPLSSNKNVYLWTGNEM